MRDMMNSAMHESRNSGAPTALDLVAAQWQKFVNHSNSREWTRNTDEYILRDVSNSLVLPLFRFFGSEAAEAALVEHESHKIGAVVGVLAQRYEVAKNITPDFSNEKNWLTAISQKEVPPQLDGEITLIDAAYKRWGTIGIDTLVKAGQSGFKGVRQSVVELAEIAAKLQVVEKAMLSQDTNQHLPTRRVKQAQEIAKYAAEMVINGYIKPEDGAINVQSALKTAEHAMFMKKLSKGMVGFAALFVACAPLAPTQASPSAENTLVPAATQISSYNHMDTQPQLLDNPIALTQEAATAVPTLSSAAEFNFAIKGLSATSNADNYAEAFKAANLDPSAQSSTEWINDQLMPLVTAADNGILDCTSVNIIGDGGNNSNWEPVAYNNGLPLWARNKATGEWNVKAIVYNDDNTVNTTDYEYLPITDDSSVQIVMVGDTLMAIDGVVSVNNENNVPVETGIRLLVADQDGNSEWVWNEYALTSLARTQGYDVASFNNVTGELEITNGKKLKYVDGVFVEQADPNVIVDLGQGIWERPADMTIDLGNGPIEFEFASEQVKAEIMEACTKALWFSKYAGELGGDSGMVDVTGKLVPYSQFMDQVRANNGIMPDMYQLGKHPSTVNSAQATKIGTVDLSKCTVTFKGISGDENSSPISGGTRSPWMWYKFGVSEGGTIQITLAPSFNRDMFGGPYLKKDFSPAENVKNMSILVAMWIENMKRLSEQTSINNLLPNGDLKQGDPRRVELNSVVITDADIKNFIKDHPEAATKYLKLAE